MNIQSKFTTTFAVLLLLAGMCQLPSEARGGRQAQAQAMQQVILSKHKGLTPQKQKELFYYRHAQMMIKRYQAIKAAYGGHMPNKVPPLFAKAKTVQTRR